MIGRPSSHYINISQTPPTRHQTPPHWWGENSYLCKCLPSVSGGEPGVAGGGCVEWWRGDVDVERVKTPFGPEDQQYVVFV